MINNRQQLPLPGCHSGEDKTPIQTPASPVGPEVKLIMQVLKTVNGIPTTEKHWSDGSVTLHPCKSAGGGPVTSISRHRESEQVANKYTCKDAISTTRKVGDLGAFSVSMDDSVLQRINFWTQKTYQEISGMLSAELLPDGQTIRVKDVYLLNQKNTGTFTDIDDEALGKLVYKLMLLDKEDGGNRLQSLRGWWHSHADMGTFWSGQDDDCISSKLDDRGPEWFLAIVNNRKGEMRVRVDLKAPRLKLDKVSMTVHREVDEEAKARWESEYNEKISVSSYSYGGYDGGYSEGYQGGRYTGRYSRSAITGGNKYYMERDVVQFTFTEVCDVYDKELGAALSVLWEKEFSKFNGVAAVGIWLPVEKKWAVWGNHIAPGQLLSVRYNEKDYTTKLIGGITGNMKNGQAKLYPKGADISKCNSACLISIVMDDDALSKLLTEQHQRAWACFLTEEDMEIPREIQNLLAETYDETSIDFSSDEGDNSIHNTFGVQDSFFEMIKEVEDFAYEEEDDALRKRALLWIQRMKKEQLAKFTEKMIPCVSRVKDFPISPAELPTRVKSLRNLAKEMTEDSPVDAFVEAWQLTVHDTYCTFCFEPVASSEVVCPQCSSALASWGVDGTEETDLAEVDEDTLFAAETGETEEDSHEDDADLLCCPHCKETLSMDIRVYEECPHCHEKMPEA